MIRRACPSIALMLLVGACGTPGVTLDGLESVAGSPSATTASMPPAPVASREAGPSEMAVPSASSGAPTVKVDRLASVLVNDLVVRSAPGVDPEASSILPQRLTSGDRVFVVEGPVEASGYRWYLVAPLRQADGAEPPFGWIASASREGEPWIGTADPDCPDTVDLAAVLALQPLERLTCFGRNTLTLTGPRIVCGAGGGPWTFEPAWIAVLGGCGLAIDDSGDAMLYRVPPGGTDPGMTAPLTVRGHFDDEAAETCRVTTADPLVHPAPSVEQAQLMCRTEFVLER